MSLAINATTSEGLVLAADSRQSFLNRKRMTRIGSDNASKLFQINKRSGVAAAGLAFLKEGGVSKSTSKFIDEFKRETDVEKLDIKEIAYKLHNLFNKKYNWKDHLDKLPEQIKNNLKLQGCEVLEVKKGQYNIQFSFKDRKGITKKGIAGVEKIILLVAGYNKDGSYEVYHCDIPGEIQKKRDSKEKGIEYGASWIGQTDVIVRIVLGYDSRIKNLKFINETSVKNSPQEINKQLRNLEYIIQWGTMALQDAIDFCILMIQTTSAIQRFSDGIVADPGNIPGVGGPIDVAVITPDKGFVWINRKKLKIGEVEKDFD